MMRLRARSSRSPQPRPFYLSNPNTRTHFCANYFDPFPCFLTFLPTGWPHSPKTFQIFKYDQNWTESCPKLLHKHSRNGAKPSNNSSKLVQKWSRNNPQMIQKRSKNRQNRATPTFFCLTCTEILSQKYTHLPTDAKLFLFRKSQTYSSSTNTIISRLFTCPQLSLGASNTRPLAHCPPAAQAQSQTN